MSGGRLWLGEVGNEVELSPIGRKLAIEDLEITKEGRTASGRLVVDVIARKKKVILTYSVVTGDILTTLSTLYALNKNLNLKIENEDTTITEYTVKFRPFSRARVLLSGGWLWENISLVLEEV